MSPEEEKLLQGFQAERDVFVKWISWSPELTERVLGAFETLRRVQGSFALQDLTAGRDAAGVLVMVGQQNGFQGVVALYMHFYEVYCRTLLAFWFEAA